MRPNTKRKPIPQTNQRNQESILCKKQCQLRDTRCLSNTTQTITYQHIAVPTIKRLEKPMVLSRMQAVAVGSWSYHTSFEILEGNDAGLFGIAQNQNTGALQLVRPIRGPNRYTLYMEMSVLTQYSNRRQITRHLALVVISVSAYEF
ncbi:putative Fibulin-1/sw [Daphnia magna]|uniref:Putative Fibulin-1/sw n=1 Tax=Daphnia magna TaxID=35525 RepID=A0A164RZ67_9CRUS|nr:putative Fibulin-1/sw [Daphnia magna]